jgi:NAD(P)-dependent dehydrogenase (short-subunit alcohol dehydrogenase family)
LIRAQLHGRSQPHTGIGAAVAHAFVRAGCTKLILTDLNTATLTSASQSLQSLASQSGAYTTILTVPGDISDPSFVDHLFAEIKGKFGRLDYAVNCAGISGNNKPSAESGVEDFDRINGVNYKGLWMCSRKELEIMKEQEIRERPGYGGERRQRGAIVNIASQLGVVGRPDARESRYS